MFWHQCFKGRACIRQRNAVLRTFRTRNRRNNITQIKVQRCCKLRIWRRCIAPHALCFGIFLDHFHAVFITASKAQIVQRFFINREETTCRAIFWCHVGNRCLIRQCKRIQALAIKLNKLTNNAQLTQHLNHSKNKVSRRCAFFQLTCQLKANNLWDQHRNRLTKHGGFGLDTADAPTQNGQAIHHCCMRICSNQCIWVHNLFARILLIFAHPRSLRQIFKVHLVTNTCTRRYNAEVFKRALPPFQKLITLAIAFKFFFNVRLKRRRRSEFINHYRVINDQINRNLRVNFLRVCIQCCHRLAHGGQINHSRNPSKVLHQYACRTVSNLVIG